MKIGTVLTAGVLLLQGCNIPTSWEELSGWRGWWFLEVPVETMGELLLPFITYCLAPMALFIGFSALVQSIRLKRPFWEGGWGVAMLALTGAVFVIGYGPFLTELGKGFFPEGLWLDRIYDVFNWNLLTLSPLKILIDGLAVVFTALLPLVHKVVQGMIVILTLIIIYASLVAKSPSGFVLAASLPVGWILWPIAYNAEITLAETNLPKVLTEFDAVRFFVNLGYIGTSWFLWFVCVFGIPILFFALARLVIPEREQEAPAPEGVPDDEEEELPEARGGTQYVPVPVVVRGDGQSADPEDEDNTIVTPTHWEDDKQLPERKLFPGSSGEDGKAPPDGDESSDRPEDSQLEDDDDDELPPVSRDAASYQQGSEEAEESVADDEAEASELAGDTDEEDTLPERRSFSQADQGSSEVEPARDDSEPVAENDGLPDARTPGRSRRSVSVPPGRDNSQSDSDRERLPKTSSGRVKPRPLSAPPARPETERGTSSIEVEEPPEEVDELPSVSRPLRSVPPPASSEPEDEGPARDIRTQEDLENDADSLPPASGRR